MRETYSGFQARFHQVNPLAEWTPCTAQILHLVGIAAAESSTDAVRFFAIVQRLYTFLSASPQSRSKLLENLLKQSPVVKSLSETRWFARADAVKALASNYKVLQNSVDAIARNSTQPPLVVLEAKSLVSKLSVHRPYVHCVEQRPGPSYQGIASSMELRSVQWLCITVSCWNTSILCVTQKGSIDSRMKQSQLHQDLRKLFHDEISEEAKVSDCRENFRVNTYQSSLTDYSPKSRNGSPRSRVYERFGEIRSLADSDITSKCEELPRYYDNDIQPDFEKEFRLFTKYGDFETGAEMITFLHENKLITSFPNFHIALRIYL